MSIDCIQNLRLVDLCVLLIRDTYNSQHISAWFYSHFTGFIFEYLYVYTCRCNSDRRRNLVILNVYS